MAVSFDRYVHYSGTHYIDLSAPAIIYRMNMTDTLTVHINSQSADDVILLQWASGVKIEQTGHAVKVTFGGNMVSDTLLSYEVNDITCVLDLNDISSSKIYINDTVSTTTDIGTFTKTTNAIDLSLGGDGAKIGYLKIFPDYEASATDISNRFKDYKGEFIHWDFNGHGIGRSRCNITSLTEGYNLSRSTQKLETGSPAANKATFNLQNEASGAEGAFSDDQYGTYNPANSIYNGTTDERYLTDRFRGYIETWYLNNYETMFTGRLTKGLLNRNKGADSLGRVNASFEDDISLIAETKIEDGFFWENYYLSDDTTPADSLLHQLIKKGSQKTINNYLTNSAIDDTTNTWQISGSDIVNTITFDPLSKGEIFNFSVVVTAAWTGNIQIIEATPIAEGDSTSLAVAETQTGEKIYSVTHTVTGTGSDRIKCKITSYTSLSNFKEGMLIKNKVPVYFYVANTNSGTSFISDESDKTSDTYEQIGIIAQNVLIQKRWHQQEPETSIWSPLKDISTASGGRYLGLQSDGIFRFDAALAEEGDPENIKTIDVASGVVTDLGAYETNKLKVKGVRIQVQNNEMTVWNDEASGVFNREAGDNDYLVANNDTWPEPNDFGDFFAEYET